MVPLGSQTLQYFQLSNRANYCGVWDFRTGINGQCRIRLKGSSDIAIGNVVGSNIFTLDDCRLYGRYRTDQRHERYVEQRDPSLRACLNRIIYLCE